MWGHQACETTPLEFPPQEPGPSIWAAVKLPRDAPGLSRRARRLINRTFVAPRRPQTWLQARQDGAREPRRLPKSLQEGPSWLIKPPRRLKRRRRRLQKSPGRPKLLKQIFTFRPHRATRAPRGPKLMPNKTSQGGPKTVPRKLHGDPQTQTNTKPYLKPKLEPSWRPATAHGADLLEAELDNDARVPTVHVAASYKRARVDGGIGTTSSPTHPSTLAHVKTIQIDDTSNSDRNWFPNPHSWGAMWPGGAAAPKTAPGEWEWRSGSIDLDPDRSIDRSVDRSGSTDQSIDRSIDFNARIGDAVVPMTPSTLTPSGLCLRRPRRLCHPPAGACRSRPWPGTVNVQRRWNDEWRFNSGNPGHGGIRCKIG